MKNWILASLLVGFALPTLRAAANPVFSHSADFGFSTATKFGKNDAVWSGGLNTLFSYDRPGPNLQVGGSYDHIPSGSTDIWSANGNAFWRGGSGSVGISAGYGSLDTGSANKTVTSYGAFGEWYMLPGVTARLKGGAFDGGITGWYSGGNIEEYPTDYIGVAATYNYTRVNGGHVHNFGVDMEFLASRRYPLSVVVGYERTSTRTVNTNAIMGRLRYRFGVRGSLAAIDRNGPTSWDGLVPLR